MSSLPKESDRCNFYYTDGRRCRMLKVEGHPELCYHHWDRGERQNDAVRHAGDLLGRRQRLDSARAVNRFLNKIVRAVLVQQIPERTASSLAYLGQLLLQSLPHVERQAAQKAAQPAQNNEPFSRLPAWFRKRVVDSTLQRAEQAAQEGRPFQPEEIRTAIEHQLAVFESFLPPPNASNPPDETLAFLKILGQHLDDPLTLPGNPNHAQQPPVPAPDSAPGPKPADD